MRGRDSEPEQGRETVAAACEAAAPLYAAVDLGTHNCRLLIARVQESGQLYVVDAFSRTVRLGEGLARSGVLSEAAMARTLDALTTCAERIGYAGACRVRAVATEACRQASNAGEFIARVRQRTGLRLEPISPAEEARLTLLGCTDLFDPRFPSVLLFDIGGGSTEVVWAEQRPGEAPRLLAALSLSSGVVTFAERFGGDRVDADRFAAMAGFIDAGLRPFDAAHNIAAAIAAGAVQMVGTSGTVTTLAALSMGLGRYRRARVDGRAIRFSAIDSLISELAETDWAARAANVCIGPERADLVIAGCAILDAICRRWPVGQVKVADRGIREGLILEMHEGLTSEVTDVAAATGDSRAFATAAYNARRE